MVKQREILDQAKAYKDYRNRTIDAHLIAQERLIELKEGRDYNAGTILSGRTYMASTGRTAPKYPGCP